MMYSSTGLRRGVAAVTVSVFMFALSACNSGNSSSFALGGVKSAGGPILSQGYNWYTVDNPLGTTNQITGINDTFQVVGNYTSATQTCDRFDKTNPIFGHQAEVASQHALPILQAFQVPFAIA